MADVRSWLQRLSDFANDICEDAKTSLRNLEKVVNNPNSAVILNALRNITDECNPQRGEDINYDLLNWVAYHIEGTVLTIVGFLGIFGNIQK